MFCFCMCRGLAHIHARNIIHGDVSDGLLNKMLSVTSIAAVSKTIRQDVWGVVTVFN